MLRRTDPFPHRKRNNRSDYKQKQRHDDIIKMEAKPLGMRELSRKKTCDIGIGCFVKISEKTICDDNQQHIKSTQHVDGQDRKSTRLNSSHVAISYAVFCLKKKIEKYN